MPGLMTQLEIGPLTLRNRIVMPPMANNKATHDGDVTEQLIQHYLKFASFLGLLIVEHAYVSRAGRLHPNQLAISDMANGPGLTRLVAALRQTRVPAAIQITHGGGRTAEEATGAPPLGPSALLQPRAKEAARELTEGQMTSIRRSFGDAARRAKRARFDAVEIHGAHGYLLNQFFSPLTNQRTDQYGGSREARLRYPLEVVATVRGAVGPDYPILYRLGADDLMPGGLTIDDAAWAAPRLVEAGVDMLDLSGGIGGSQPPGDDREGYFDYLGRAVKAVVDIPVMVTGGIKSPAVADRLVREGSADLVGVGRALLADPRWAEKAVAKLGAELDHPGGDGPA